MIMAAIVLSGCSDVLNDPFADFQYDKEEESIDSYPIERRDIEVYKLVYGNSIPKSRVTQYFKQIEGYFQEYTIGVTDEVEEGDVVAILDSSKLDILLRDQNIVNEKARLKYEKVKLTYETTGQGKFEMDSAELDYNYEKYKYNNLLLQIERLELKAVMSGAIAKEYADPGDNINSESKIIDIVDESEVYIAFAVGDAEGVGLGEILEIVIRNSDEIVYAEVIEINSSKVILRPDTIHFSFTRIGTLVYVRMLTDKRIGALLVKEYSIVMQAGRSFVYVLEDGMKSERDIKTGIAYEEYVEVLFGLDEGEQVVERP